MKQKKQYLVPVTRSIVTHVQPFLLEGSEMSSGVQQNNSGQVESVEVEKDETYNSETFTLY